MGIPGSEPESKRLRRPPLTPRARAAVAFVLIVVGLLALLSPSGFPPAPGNILFAVYVTLFLMYMLLRFGHFAVRVHVRLPGPNRVHTQERLRSALQRDRIMPLDEPTFLRGASASGQMTPHERVIGVEWNGQAKAYPLSFLSVHEVVNDTVGGAPMIVTWSPVCYSPRAFLAEATGGRQRVEFGNSGKMLLNSSVYYDRETDSQWVQFIGQAISGVRTGDELPQVPAHNTSWEAWLAAYPDTYVFDKGEAESRDIFDSYYGSGRPGIFKQRPRDRTWEAKDVVLGLTIKEQSRAFPFRWLMENPLVEQEIGGEPVLVVLERATASATAFDPYVDGRVLTFKEEGENPPRRELVPDSLEPESPESNEEPPEYEPLFIQDQQTGSRWRAISGRCEDGELAGKGLRPLQASLGFWFAWSRFFPMGEVMLPGSGPQANEPALPGSGPRAA